MIRIVAIGKKHESWIEAGIIRYQKRLKRPFDVEWVLLPHSQQQGLLARQEESERLLSALEGRSMVVLLDERGIQWSSPELAKRLEREFVHAPEVTFVIGGAFGVTEQLQQRASVVWSLSSLVLPHQLVRLVLIEQLYRAQQIVAGHGYHHE